MSRDDLRRFIQKVEREVLESCGTRRSRRTLHADSLAHPVGEWAVGVQLYMLALKEAGYPAPGFFYSEDCGARHLELRIANRSAAVGGVDPDTGLTEDEGVVFDLVAATWRAWSVLPVEHPDDVDDVRAAVHRVQDLLATRIARRGFPAAWGGGGRAVAEEAGMAEQKPSVGRIVHYVLRAEDVNKPANEGQHRAAIVTNGPFGADLVNLKVFTDGQNDGPPRDSTGMLWVTSRPHSDAHEPGSWHWPERVE